MALHLNTYCHLKTCPRTSQSELLALFHFRADETLNTLSEDPPQVSAGNGCGDPYLATDAVQLPHVSLNILS